MITSFQIKEERMKEQMKKLNAKQKKFLGTVPKKCQLVETFWDCPEISKTNNKGITLIALIITIIVMLILVGVTINVALNGNLFRKAETAKTETNKALEKEELMQIAIGEYNVQNKAVDVNAVKEKTVADYTEDTSKSQEGKTLVLQGKSGTLWEINLNTVEVKEYEKINVTYNKVYVDNSSERAIYLVFTENGLVKQIIPSLNYVITTNYNIEESVTITINNEEFIFNNAIFTENLGSDLKPNGEISFMGYISGDGTVISSFGGFKNSDGTYSSGEWTEIILDTSIDVSAYL